MAKVTLSEVDTLNVSVIITDELEPISQSSNPAVRHPSNFLGIPVSRVENPNTRGGATSEMRMSTICCGAHGLSLLITATKDGKSKTLLFDAGPEEDAWERNATRMGANVNVTDHIVLSHYHRDYSGGLFRAIAKVNAGRSAGRSAGIERVVVDLHPFRPAYRSIGTPSGPLSLEPDPTFDEVERTGCRVQLSKEARTVLDAMFAVSGEIQRLISYETGLPGGIKFIPEVGAPAGGSWVPDEQIMEERYGCGHAGVINTSMNAMDVIGDKTVHSVAGGFHMSDASEGKVQNTVRDMVTIFPRVLLGGHCTGWRFKTEIE